MSRKCLESGFYLIVDQIVLLLTIPFMHAIDQYQTFIFKVLINKCKKIKVCVWYSSSATKFVVYYCSGKNNNWKRSTKLACDLHIFAWYYQMSPVILVHERKLLIFARSYIVWRLYTIAHWNKIRISNGKKK